MDKINQLEKRIANIEARNRKVELDKAWETSFTRRAILILFTYLSISLYFQAIKVARPWLNAVVPALAFWLSTLTLPLLKKLWQNYLHKA